MMPRTRHITPHPLHYYELLFRPPIVTTISLIEYIRERKIPPFVIHSETAVNTSICVFKDMCLLMMLYNVILEDL
jgi:hypothetical protein